MSATIRTRTRRLALAALALSLSATPLVGQRTEQEWLERCRSQSSRPTHCEVREYTLAAGAPLHLDARPNGGISLEGWDQNRVLVRARVQASAPTEAEAREIASAIEVRAEGARVSSRGPERMGNGRGWSVGYEVFVPRRSDVTAETRNGGISVAGVRGKLDLETANGGISLADVGGAVRGRTVNGGVSVRLDGAQWDGEGLELSTTNGGVSLALPEAYSADLRLSTVNGGVSGDLVGTVSRGTVESRLGAGGATLRISTTNGGIRVARR